MIENIKTQIGDQLFVDYINERVVLSYEPGGVQSVDITLGHEDLQNLGKFILSLQKKLYDEQQPIQLDNNDQPIMDDQPLEEITLESEIDRVKQLIANAGSFEADQEPDVLTRMKASVLLGETSIANQDPHGQIRSMRELAEF